MYWTWSSSPLRTSASGSRRENCRIDLRVSSRKSSAPFSRRATPTSLKRSGSAPSCARLYSAGSSLRCARSPVAPKITSVVGGTGSRSRPSVSGFSPAAERVSTAIRSAPGRALDRVAAELVAQRRQHPVRVVALPARVEARVQRGGDDRRRDVVVDRVDDRPTALARVGDMSPQALEVVALRGERVLGQLAQPRAHDRAAVPEARDLLELDRELRLVHQLEALGVRLHHPVLD